METPDREALPPVLSMAEANRRIKAKQEALGIDSDAPLANDAESIGDILFSKVLPGIIAAKRRQQAKQN